MRWTLLLVIALGACSRTAPSSAVAPLARVSTLDSATIRQLCAKPDSMHAASVSCELRDQRQPITVFPKPSVEHPSSN